MKPLTDILSRQADIDPAQQAAPDTDVDTLVKVINQQEHVIHQKEDIIEKKSTVIAEQQKRIALLEEYLRLEAGSSLWAQHREKQRPG